MKRPWKCFTTALRFAVIEQVRNHLALGLVFFFVPLWLLLAFTVFAATPVPFFLRAAHRTVTVDGNVLSQLTGAFHALALIVGFMMFLAATRSAGFDHRLVLAGYPRLSLALAKYAALLLSGAAAALYATAWITLFWQPERLGLLAVALWLAALTYGGAGVLLAAVMRSELAGMFLLIMVSFIDVGLQNPIGNPQADSPALRFLPTYGAMQCAVSAASLNTLPWSCRLRGLAWAAGTVTLGLIAFMVRTGMMRGRRPA
ncbi:ABC transporter permease [Streptomyces sp. H27-G5]|uniref:ABC transporter permease n=1 Tax=Streptomyces sp. H27-G5 TaxID=2996698 RepID=UPI00227099C6|nr:ABC transporter permease [Streptomyces sp. H27-G5]MCY0924043.1 ABC transporter permease [Streptomyces sp. H27-G5]